MVNHIVTSPALALLNWIFVVGALIVDDIVALSSFLVLRVNYRDDNVHEHFKDTLF